METLNEVKRLYDMGFAILWLYPKSKRPIGEDWTSGNRKPWDVLKKYFKKANNVGVRLGTASVFKDETYLCALDCDVKSSDPIHLKEMEVALNSFCPANEFAPRVLSGRGGGSCHIYFRTKKPQQSFKALRSSHKVKVFMPSADASSGDRKTLSEEEITKGFRSRLAWEIDVYGEGKQVVIPPSTHPDTGKEYVWETVIKDYETIPLHKNFEPSKVRTKINKTSEVKFEPVDLFSTAISDKYFDLITRGVGFEEYPSRSEALFGCLNGLIAAGLNDGQIYTVLTDPSHFMSDKPLEAGSKEPLEAAKWLQSQITKIRSEKLAELKFEDQAVVDDLDEMLGLTEEEMLEQESELVSWQTRLEGTKTGQWKNTSNNLHLILKNLSGEMDRKDAVFAYDEFNQANIYTFAPPWGDESDVGKELSDLDDIKIKTWLSKEWRIETSTQSVADITLQIGKENSFHPVQRYLRSLKWDGVERLDNMLKKYCGAVGDDQYLADVGRKFMTATVARVMSPGIKFDHILILEGNQGVGKSTFVNILSSPWYSDSLGDISNKDVIDNMRGKWIIELGELSSLNRAETNELKAFITRQVDSARKAYGRRSYNYPRQCTFVGTTNDDEYLKDSTGGRRFWPVKTTKFHPDKLRDVKDQLWAEALVCYNLAEALYLDNEDVRNYATNEQADRMVIDEIQTQVKEIIAKEDFPEQFTFDDVWIQICLLNGKGSSTCEYSMQIRIKKALQILGYPKIRKRVEYGVRKMVWFKDKSVHGLSSVQGEFVKVKK